MAEVMVDIDDVLFPWADEIHERARRRGLHDLDTYTSWHMWEDYGCPKEAWLDIVVDAALDGMYVDVAPMPGAVEALRRLAWEGHNIHLVTARGFPMTGTRIDHSSEIKDWTDTWVHEHAVPHKTLSYAKDKVAIQDDLGVRFDYAIDDGPHNYDALADAGVRVYLLDRPHNQNHRSGKNKPWRVNSVDEFVSIILKESA